MAKTTTKGITVRAYPEYRPSYSNPQTSKFLFSYQIGIENQSNRSIQLIARYWHIFDSNGDTREVKGEGVVGDQPILDPLEHYEYSSWCPLMTELGYMEGHYVMQDVLTGNYFNVLIPRFDLIAPQKLN